MSLVTNVFRRGASYYVRTRVPARFRLLLERKELWRSLRTSDAREARQRASVANLLTETLWRDLERAMSSKRKVPSPEEIKSLIDQWLRAELSEDAYLRTAPEGEWHDGVILRRDPGGLNVEVIEVLGDTELRDLFALPDDERATRIGPNGYLVTDVCDLHLRQAAFRRGLEGAVDRHKENDGALAERHVADVFRRAGFDPTCFSEAFEVATRRMTRAHRDVLLAVQSRDVAGWRPDLDDDPAAPLLARVVPSPVETAVPKAEPRQPIGTTVKEAARLKVAEARKLGELSDGRLIEYERAAELFSQWADGDLDLGEVTPAVAGRFREDLIAYPANASKKAAYRAAVCFRPDRQGERDRRNSNAERGNGERELSRPAQGHLRLGEKDWSCPIKSIHRDQRLDGKERGRRRRTARLPGRRATGAVLGSAIHRISVGPRRRALSARKPAG